MPIGKTVLFFGAGASVDAGVPTMEHFVDTMYSLYAGEEEFKAVFETINDFRRVYHNSHLDLNNIESLFSAFEMRKLILNTSENDQVYELLKKMIVGTVEQTTKIICQQNGDFGSTGYYTLMLDMLDIENNRQSYSFITMNYDIGLDIAIRNRYKIDYGFEAERKPAWLPVYKLHGSVNWYLGDGNQILVEDVMDAFHNSEGRRSLYGTGGMFALEFSRFFDKPTVIVPPTFSKTFDNIQLKNVWKHAASALKEADNIYFIGYSVPMTDTMIRYLFALGMEIPEHTDPSAPEHRDPLYRSMLTPLV